MVERFLLRRNFNDVVPFLNAVSSQADHERTALGFLPESAYAEAARQRKLIVMIAHDGEGASYVGHLLFGGIFPILRVRQIAIAPKYRRTRHATTLLRALIAQGEKEAYLSIVANVASDLEAANAFYERNGFVSTRLKAGGKTRNRTINVRILQLETRSLISYMVGSVERQASVALQSRKRSYDAPIYAIDLNVFFDTVKTRTRSEDAGQLFEAAFNHQIRLAVSQEFISELERTSNNRSADPVLSLAKRIPMLPPQEAFKIDSLTPLVARAVFPEKFAKQCLKSNDRSDVLHLAHAISAGAAGYITSDTAILNSRDALMEAFKLDVIGLSEFVDLIDLPKEPGPSAPVKATKNFRLQRPTAKEAAAFLRNEGISLEPHFDYSAIEQSQRLAVLDEDGVIGVGLARVAHALERPSRIAVCVRQDHPFSSTVADALISEQVRYCSSKTPCHVTMVDIPSHPITLRIALGQGFQHMQGQLLLSKVAFGRPITEATWKVARLSIERLVGLKLQRNCPKYDEPKVRIATAAAGHELELFDLETLLSPTLLVLPKRTAVIVPITRAFAADLLGTDEQYSFLEVPEAQFLTRRTYFNTTKSERAMSRGSVIAFYESRKRGGRGALVAMGRIVDVTSIPATKAPEALQRGAVVDDFGMISKSSRILATTFDNLLPLRKPVPLETLRALGCATGTNFVSATPISDKHLTAIISAGFIDE